MPQPKIALGLYSGGTVPATNTPNVVSMALDLAAHDMLAGFSCEGEPFFQIESSRVDANRNNLIATFLKTPGATHLFIVDDDMIHPPSMPRHLLSRNKPIISGTYFHRQPNMAYPQAYYLDGVAADRRPGYGKHINNNYQPLTGAAVEFYSSIAAPDVETPVVITLKNGELPHTSVRQMDASGWGCLLLSREALEQLEPPYLMNELGLNGDLAFFKQVKDKGIECFVDFALIATHIGTRPIGLGSFHSYVESFRG